MPGKKKLDKQKAAQQRASAALVGCADSLPLSGSVAVAAATAGGRQVGSSYHETRCRFFPPWPRGYRWMSRPADDEESHEQVWDCTPKRLLQRL